MAYLTVEINIEAQTIEDLISHLQLGDKHDAANGIMNQIAGVIAGAQSGSIKLVVKDAASTINTSGSGSISVTYPA